MGKVLRRQGQELPVESHPAGISSPTDRLHSSQPQAREAPASGTDEIHAGAEPRRRIVDPRAVHLQGSLR